MDLLEIQIAVPRSAFTVRAALSLSTETLAIIGPSGAGKTTMLRSVAGLERHCTGRIVLGDVPWLDSERGIELRPERRRVGYLPQDYGLFPHLTVAANVQFAGRRPRPELLEQLGIAHLAATRPPALSGGERQRVALARALARDPQVLLLDEPFSALDAITRHQVRDELGDILATLGLPVLLVTHAFSDATALAERIAVLDRGQLAQVGTAEELLAAPANALVAGLTGANVLAGTATSATTGSVITLDGGGVLESATSATGRVQVAIQPWQLRLADPGASRLTDTVVGLHRDGGALAVRLSRLTVQVPASGADHAELAEGTLVGLRADPADVRVLAGTPPT